jgi:hypothetical protein
MVMSPAVSEGLSRDIPTNAVFYFCSILHTYCEIESYHYIETLHIVSASEWLDTTRFYRVTNLPASIIYHYLFARDRCCDFKNIFAEKFSEKIGFFCSNYG